LVTLITSFGNNAVVEAPRMFQLNADLNMSLVVGLAFVVASANGDIRF
jgi:hypothetical protein